MHRYGPYSRAVYKDYMRYIDRLGGYDVKAHKIAKKMLIDSRSIDRSQFSQFRTDFGKVLAYLNYDSWEEAVNEGVPNHANNPSLRYSFHDAQEGKRILD